MIFLTNESGIFSGLLRADGQSKDVFDAVNALPRSNTTNFAKKIRGVMSVLVKRIGENTQFFKVSEKDPFASWVLVKDSRKLKGSRGSPVFEMETQTNYFFIKKYFFVHLNPPIPWTREIFFMADMRAPVL